MSKRISELESMSSVGKQDEFAIVDTENQETKKVSIETLHSEFDEIGIGSSEQEERKKLLIRINKNLFNKNNANMLSGIINGSTRKIEVSDGKSIVYIPCKQNKTYTISKVASSMFAIGTTIDIPANNVSVSNLIQNNAETSLTITTSSTAKYLVIFYYHSTYDTTITEQEIRATIQVEYGDTATSYESYDSTKMFVQEEDEYKKLTDTISVGTESNDSKVWFKKSKNLADYEINTTSYGITTIYNNGVINTNGTAISSGQFFESTYIPFKAGTYTIHFANIGGSGGGTGFYLRKKSTNSNIALIEQLTTPVTTTFTLDTDDELKIYGYINNGRTLNNLSMAVQIETGTSYTGFETPDTMRINVENNGSYKEIYNGNFNNYLTIEQVIGKWIDGKPIYRKIIDIGSLPNNETKLIRHNISNLGLLTKINIIGKSSSGVQISYSYYDNGAPLNSVTAYCDDAEIHIVSKNDRSSYKAYAILEYTKTTD